jgi:excinuclease ABC subunit B
VHGRAIFYADRITGSMQRCIEETGRRRVIQVEYNREHGITPTTVTKSVDQVRLSTRVADARTTEREERRVAEPARGYAVMDTESLEKMLEQQMREAAAAMDFELAAQLRDQLFEVRAHGTASAKNAQTAVGGSRASR